MEKIYTIVLAISAFLNAILTIAVFVQKAKKPVDSVVDKKFEEALKPLKEDLCVIKNDINRLDKNECKNYLVDFIEDVKNGIKKDDTQLQRATEVYDHYRNDLHLNTYIHDGWEKYVNKN